MIARECMACRGHWGVFFLFHSRESALRRGKNGVSVSICGPRSHRTALVYLGARQTRSVIMDSMFEPSEASLRYDFLPFCTVCYRGVSQESRDLPHGVLHNATLISQNKPRNLIFRSTIATTLHLHSNTIIARLQSRSTRSHQSSRKLRKHRTLSNQPS